MLSQKLIACECGRELIGTPFYRSKRNGDGRLTRITRIYLCPEDRSEWGREVTYPGNGNQQQLAHEVVKTPNQFKYFSEEQLAAMQKLSLGKTTIDNFVSFINSDRELTHEKNIFRDADALYEVWIGSLEGCRIGQELDSETRKRCGI